MSACIVTDPAIEVRAVRPGDIERLPAAADTLGLILMFL
jgi:hypothetical protein